MECVDGGDNRRGLLKFTYSLISGITSFKKYGLGVASVSWPKEIVDAAEELYDQLEPPKKVRLIIILKLILNNMSL